MSSRWPNTFVRLLIVAVVSAILALALHTALAGADLTDPPDSSNPPGSVIDDLQNTPQENPETVPDTDYTPHAKEGAGPPGEQWRQVGGARFPSTTGADPTALLEDSPTSYADNLYDVDFTDTQLGLVGGSTCQDPADPADTVSSDPDAERNCRPTAFLYTKTEERGEVWDRVALPHGGEPGFVGAIAWLDPTTAMAVGGTGTYPRREPAFDAKNVDGEPCNPAGADPNLPYGWNCDQAGMARAWLYRDGSWCELGRDDGCPALPSGMRGLTAVDFRLVDGTKSVGFAGALGQIWRWDGALGGEGAFDPAPIDNSSPADKLAQTGAIFDFRVRDLRFGPIDRVWAQAVTDGCCSQAQNPTTPQALQLTFRDPGSSDAAGPPRWFAPRPTGQATCCGVSVNATQAESLYSLSLGQGPCDTCDPSVSLLYTTAANDSVREPPSTFYGCSWAGTPSSATGKKTGADSASVTNARLLAIDGPTASCPQGPDWAGGELRSQRVAEHGRQGVVVATRTQERDSALANLSVELKRDDSRVGPLATGSFGTPDPRPTPDELTSGDYEPTSEETIHKSLASFHYLVPSYTLNSLEMISSTGQGWAVGDHGALLRVGGERTTASESAREPSPPSLGPKTPQALPEQLPYDAPHSDRASPVPALFSRPLEQLPKPELVGAGSPDATHARADSGETEDVGAIVMSRDGTEGWALGPNPRTDSLGASGFYYGRATFYHYDGAWTRCDPTGIAGQLPADPACETVAGLKRYIGEASGTRVVRQVQIVAAARVPLENDGNPSNDDEFEVVAIGTAYAGDPERHGRDYDPVVLRYRDGRWDFEAPSVRDSVRSFSGGVYGAGYFRLKDVAFTAPDDGWILARDSETGKPGSEGAAIHSDRLFHFDGERWSECPLGERAGASASVGCGSPRIPKWSTNTTNEPTPRLVAAGDRVYLFGERPTQGSLPEGHAAAATSTRVPYILYHERGGEWTDGSGPGEDRSGYDPAYDPANLSGAKTDSGVQGRLYSLAVTQNPDGSYSGWAQGRFYARDFPPNPGATPPPWEVLPPDSILMRLEPGEGWRPFRDPGALEDYMTPQQVIATSDRHPTEARLQLQITDRGGEPQAFIAQRNSGRLMRFASERGRWEVVPSKRPQRRSGAEDTTEGLYQALGADNQGGFWAAVKNNPHEANWANGGQVFFYHYTDHPHEPVFADIAQPFGDRPVRFTSLAGAPDGALWAATDSGTLARYERAGGWQLVQIPGWDPGRVVTAASDVNAVAVGENGSGVAVGKGGRIAELSPDSVRLDAAASNLCEGTGLGPGCGTSRDLTAAAVEPDGSALIGGEAMAMLWRPAGGPFQRIPSPPGGTSATITGIAMPAPDQAWIATDTGLVYAGTMSAPGAWTWRAENKVVSGRFKGTTLGAIAPDRNRPLRAIAIDGSGRGYAVGDRGLVLERTGDPDQPWRRLRGPGTDDLTSATVAQGSGEAGALIGGRNGLVWTALGDQIEVARPADYTRIYNGSPLNEDADRATIGPLTGQVVGMALLPGISDGQSEAWVAIQARGEGTNRLLHYASDPSEPLLDPGRGLHALADSPPERNGELSVLAFGKSDCSAEFFCPALGGNDEQSQAILDRVVAETQTPSDGRTTPDLALMTGDATDSTGVTGTQAAGLDKTGDPIYPAFVADGGAFSFQPRTIGARKHRRFAELVTDPLADAGVPTLGAVGSGDLSRNNYTGGRATDEQAKTGENFAWRKGFATQPSPWANGEKAVSASGVELSEAPGSAAQAHEVSRASADADGPDLNVVRPVEVGGGAHTHYAADVLRRGERVARLVVLDSSLRNVSTADPLQSPVERDGQLGWLERMLCFRGEVAPSGGECSREGGQEAIVLSNTPTYTYAPLDPTALATDAAVLESLYLKYDVSVVVSGRLGWNGRYWATAPGVHEPCPGGAYQEAPPTPGTRVCDRGEEQLPGAGQLPALAPLAEALGSGGPPPEPVAETKRAVDEAINDVGGAGLVPFVVASGAGGKFGPNGESGDGSAADGFWHGYTVVRVDGSGDPRKLIVEQRPVLDWIHLSAASHVLRPGQRMTLKGIGREPIAFSLQTRASATRYDRISTAAITHRYDLVIADPERPYLPLEDANGDYVPVPAQIASVDRVTGAVRTGRGRGERTYTVAILSVGDKVASYPIAFEPRRSATAQRPKVALPAIPRSARAPTAQQPVRLSETPPPPPPQPPATPGSPLSSQTLQPPQPPELPSLPPVNAAGPPPAPSLNAPPPPPPPPPAPVPPVQQQPQPLGLGAKVQAVAIVPSVNPPAPPPVNPAPPGGAAARKEAKQRQAATAKSEEGSQSAGSEAAENGGDLAQGGSSADGLHMTRRSTDRPQSSFSPVAPSEQASAWARGALYGGGIGLTALILAFGWGVARPTPRRRAPDVPAPAWARRQSR